MNFVDISFILFCLIFLVYGFKNGFILEIAGILGIFISLILSIFFPINRFINIKNQSISYLLSFLIYFSLIYLIMIFISKFIKKTPLGFIDRLLGMIFGLVKGALVGLIIIFIISYFPLKSNAVRESLSMKIINYAKPLITNILKTLNIKTLKI